MIQSHGADFPDLLMFLNSSAQATGANHPLTRVARPRPALLAFVLVAGALAAGCTSTGQSARPTYPVTPEALAMYAAVETEPFKVPAVPVSRIEPQFLRQTVATPPGIKEKPGTIVVDPGSKYLYLVGADGTSMRYGIGVGRQGFSWSGSATIHDKQHWPKWFPPPEMQARDTFAAKYADGMDGGPKNPLGSRALYLWQNNKDTLFRIHATTEPYSIGKAVSSGCIRMFNQDIIDLYERVPLETRVVVLSAPEAVPVDPYGPAVVDPSVQIAPPQSASLALPAKATGGT
jgi:lipoprotein-anchoring transpeptidase ErfK/SrfK